MPSHDWSNVRNLLAACPGGAESLAAALPALNQLHHALPATRISLWTTVDAAPVVEQLPWLDELLTSPAAWTGALLPLTAVIENRGFDAAIIFTAPQESPYPAAYTCYLAGIPLRAGQSSEFGGSVLSPWVRSGQALDPEEHHRHLLCEAGLVNARLRTVAVFSST